AGKRIGNVFVKKVKYSKHFLRIGQAWGIDSEVFDLAEREGCNEILIKDEETGKIYRTTFENYRSKSWVNDFGFGSQRFLAEKYFEIVNPNQEEFEWK
ncbi:MAG: hypothetical protein WC479_09775, partial [Candidatus Izemoplasmatales bacterium]